MSAFIKLLDSRLQAYLKLELNQGVTKQHADEMSIRLSNAVCTYLNGVKAGELVEGPIKAGQLVKFSFGKMTPKRYTAIVSPSPDLLDYGIDSGTRFFPSDGKYEVFFTFQAVKQVDLTEVRPSAILYLME